MEFAEQLKSQIDIVSVVREYVPSLRKAGTRHIGPCPFHQEKTPSFGVHSTHQFYKCFGCGAGGDVIKFVMEIEGLTFWEALKLLAERHGIPLPQKAAYSDDETKLRTAIYEMHELAQQLFRQAYDSAAGAAARDYVKKRGIAPATVLEFGIGFADRSGQTLLRALQQRRFPTDQIEASGLVSKRQDGSGHYDRFRGRLMFPIQNETGKVIAFAGRAMSPDDEPKYMNSSETRIYRKSYVLYNLHRARKQIRQSDRSILVEGYMDVIGLFEAGVLECVASCGTALTEHQVRSLRRHSDKVVVNFDPDAAGSNAAQRSIQMLLAEGVHIKVLQLAGGLDPDEYVREHGPAAYAARLKAAPGCFHWLADRARSQFDMNSAEGRVAGFQQVLLPAIKLLPDKLEQAAVAEEVASYLRVEPELVRREFRRVSRGAAKAPVQPGGAEVHPKEKMLVNLLLKSLEARREVIPRLRGLEIIQRFHTWPVLRVILQLEETVDNWTYSDLEGRLEDGDKALLAGVVFADPLDEQDAPLQQALAFLPKLERKEREARQAEIKSRIKAAEQAGDMAQAMRLAEELNRVGTK